MQYMKNIFYNNMNLDFEHLRIVREQDFIFHNKQLHLLCSMEKNRLRIYYLLSQCLNISLFTGHSTKTENSKSKQILLTI